MKERWKRVKFGDFLRPNTRPYTLGSDEDANLVGMRLYGKGPFHRELKPALRIAKKSHFVIRSGDIIYNKLFAWKGTFGVVPPALDGMLVSDKFPTYELDRARVDGRYLRWYFQTPDLWAQAQAMSTGSAALSKLTLNPPKFLLLDIPLPPLIEQQMIVARIEELAAKISEALALRKESSTEMEVFVERARTRLFEGAHIRDHVPLDSIAILERGKFSHRPRNDPRFFGGEHPWIQIAEIESSTKYIREYHVTLNDEGLAVSRKFPRGTVLVSIAATIGAVGILGFDCCVPDSVVGVTPQGQTNHGFLYHYLRYVRTHLERVAPQSAQKNVNLQILRHLPVPDCTPDEQARIGRYMDSLHERVEAATDVQIRTAQQVDALLPSILDRAFKGEL